MLWQLVRGIQDIETRSLYPLGAQELRTDFFVILGLTIISLFAANILALLSPLFLLLLIVAIFVVLVLFLVLVLRAAKGYEMLCSGVGHTDSTDDYSPGSEN